MGFQPVFFFSSRRRHTRLVSDWSSDVCSSDLDIGAARVTVMDFDTRRDCREPGRLERIEEASGIFFTGGNQQIGRASCRERVSNPVGADVLKKERRNEPRAGGERGA